MASVVLSQPPYAEIFKSDLKSDPPNVDENIHTIGPHYQFVVSESTDKLNFVISCPLTKTRPKKVGPQLQPSKFKKKKWVLTTLCLNQPRAFYTSYTLYDEYKDDGKCVMATRQYYKNLFSDFMNYSFYLEKNCTTPETLNLSSTIIVYGLYTPQSLEPTSLCIAIAHIIKNPPTWLILPISDRKVEAKEQNMFTIPCAYGTIRIDWLSTAFGPALGIGPDQGFLTAQEVIDVSYALEKVLVTQ